MMMVIHCIIIDDEPLARKGLREYIGDTGFLSLLADFESPMNAMELIASGQVQLVFLDIEMPKISGLQFFKTLQHPPPVIFTTAYPQYALEGFELNALDYLVKPVSFDRFYRAALRAREYYELRTQNNTGTAQPAQDHLFIKTDGKLVRIRYDDILFVEAVQNYVMIHTTGKKYMTWLTFHSIEEFLPADRFIKTHKSFLVSVARIDSIEGNEVQLGTASVPISRSLKETVLQKLVNNRFLKR